MKHISLWISSLCVATATLFVGCDTDVESVDINQPGVENQDPELYASYLQDLRDYKASNHKVVFAYFDNKDDFYTQGDHLMAMPDSIDYAVLMTPYDLCNGIVEEMKEVREKKGTKTLYTVDYADIKAVYDLRATELSAAQLNGERLDEEMPELNAFVTDSVRQAVSYCDQYGYDGIIFAYNAGLNKENLTNEQIKLYAGYEDSFVSPAMEWQIAHPDKIMVFQGRPTIIYDYVILQNSKYVIIPCRTEASVESLSYAVMQQLQATEADNAKYLPLVESVSLDTKDTETGWFKNGSRAVVATAQWVASMKDDSAMAGMAIYNVNREYFNSTQAYLYVRKAIGLMNPTAKN